MQPVRPAAVIFDWDNTLVDSWPMIHEALCATFAHMGHPPWDMAETKRRTRESLRNAFPKLFGTSWERARDHYLTFFETHHLARMKPLAGAETLLQGLQRSGIWLSVVSNKTGRILRREVAALGWERYFGKVVGAGDVAFDKPHRAPVDEALLGSGVDAGPAVWFVGDTDIDVRCAANAGCTPVMLHTAYEAVVKLGQELQCSEILMSFADCTHLLEAYRHACACKMDTQ